MTVQKTLLVLPILPSPKIAIFAQKNAQNNTTPPSDILVHFTDPKLAQFLHKFPQQLYFASTFVNQSVTSDSRTYYSEALKFYSLIQINFKLPEMPLITKDAKCTMSNVIGNIGGTFGIFLGFSTLGFAQDLVQLLRQIKAFWRPQE